MQSTDFTQTHLLITSILETNHKHPPAFSRHTFARYAKIIAAIRKDIIFKHQLFQEPKLVTSQKRLLKKSFLRPEILVLFIKSRFSSLL